MFQEGCRGASVRHINPADNRGAGACISPDPFVQNPTHSQNYDRFGYTYNNPLSYTDPTGFVFKKIGRSAKRLARSALRLAIRNVTRALGNDIMLFVADTTGNSWLRLAAQVFTNFALDKAERKLVGSFNSTGSGGGAGNGVRADTVQDEYQVAQLSSPRLRELREREAIERESQRSATHATGAMVGDFEVVVVGGVPSAQLSDLLSSEAFRVTVQEAIRRLDAEQNLQNAPGAVGRRNTVLGTPVTTGQGFGDFGKPAPDLFESGRVPVQHRGLGPVLEPISEHSQDALVFAVGPFHRDRYILDPNVASIFRQRAHQAGAPSFVYSQEAVRQRRIYVFEADR